MDNPKPKYKFSILTVVIIFLLIYLGELALGAGVFFNFILPKIHSFQQTRSAQSISQNIVSEQTTIYALLKDNKLNEASKSAQLMLNQSKTQNEKALSLQVMGEVFAAQNNYQQAKVYFTNALNLNSNLSGAYIGLAAANIIEKDFQNAITNTQKAISLAPSRTDFYYILGLAYYGAGDKNKAIQNIQKASQANPNNTEYKKTLDDLKNGTFQTTTQPETQSQTQTTSPSQQSSGPGYTKQDIDNLVQDLKNMDQDSQNIQNFKGNSSYNQQTVDKIIQSLTQRKTLAQQLLDKMGKNESLTQTDFNIWDQYDALTQQQNTLVKSLYNGNGGF